VKKRLLFVDPDEMIRKMLVRIFQSEDGYELETSEGGEDALCCVRNRHYNLVTMNSVPGMAPEKFVAEVRKALPATKIVIYTGGASFDLTKVGADLIVVKCGDQRLPEAVSRILAT